MIDITAATHVPPDIDALDAYWRAMTDDDRAALEYLYVPTNYKLFFDQLRISMHASMSQNQLPKECKAEVRHELEKGKKPEHARSEGKSVSEKKGDILSPFPTEIARCCPFVPVRSTKSERFYNNAVLTDNAWGTIMYTGPELTTMHEDVLLTVLALIARGKGQRITDAVTGRDSFIYVGSRLEIFKLRGNATPSALNYDSLKKIMTDMSRVSITYTSKSSAASATAINIDNLTSYDERNDGAVTLRINGYFIQAYEQKLVTWINLTERIQIESLYGKALHRFISSHKDWKWAGSIKTITAALNIPAIPMFKVRYKIKKAISEMVVLGILTQASCVDGNDVVKLVKARKISHKT